MWYVHSESLDAFPEGYDSGQRDVPGKGCANGFHFEVNPCRKEVFQKDAKNI